MFAPVYFLARVNHVSYFYGVEVCTYAFAGNSPVLDYFAYGIAVLRVVDFRVVRVDLCTAVGGASNDQLDFSPCVLYRVGTNVFAGAVSYLISRLFAIECEVQDGRFRDTQFLNQVC